MQTASEAYKQSMDMQCRDQFYMWVTIGVINQVAQSEAYAEGTFSKMANPMITTTGNIPTQLWNRIFSGWTAPCCFCRRMAPISIREL